MVSRGQFSFANEQAMVHKLQTSNVCGNCTMHEWGARAAGVGCKQRARSTGGWRRLLLLVVLHSCGPAWSSTAEATEHGPILTHHNFRCLPLLLDQSPHARLPCVRNCVCS